MAKKPGRVDLEKSEGLLKVGSTRELPCGDGNFRIFMVIWIP